MRNILIGSGWNWCGTLLRLALNLCFWYDLYALIVFSFQWIVWQYVFVAWLDWVVISWVSVWSFLLFLLHSFNKNRLLFLVCFIDIFNSLGCCFNFAHLHRQRRLLPASNSSHGKGCEVIVWGREVTEWECMACIWCRSLVFFWLVNDYMSHFLLGHFGLYFDWAI